MNVDNFIVVPFAVSDPRFFLSLFNFRFTLVLGLTDICQTKNIMSRVHTGINDRNYLPLTLDSLIPEGL